MGHPQRRQPGAAPPGTRSSTALHERGLPRRGRDAGVGVARLARVARSAHDLAEAAEFGDGDRPQHVAQFRRVHGRRAPRARRSRSSRSSASTSTISRGRRQSRREYPALPLYLSAGTPVPAPAGPPRRGRRPLPLALRARRRRSRPRARSRAAATARDRLEGGDRRMNPVDLNDLVADRATSSHARRVSARGRRSSRSSRSRRRTDSRSSRTDHKCARLHGHSFRVEIHVDGRGRPGDRLDHGLRRHQGRVQAAARPARPQLPQRDRGTREPDEREPRRAGSGIGCEPQLARTRARSSCARRAPRDACTRASRRRREPARGLRTARTSRTSPTTAASPIDEVGIADLRLPVRVAGPRRHARSRRSRPSR